MPGDGLDQLTHLELEERVRDLTHDLARQQAGRKELEQRAAAAEQSAAAAAQQARQVQARLEREVAQMDALRVDRDNARAQASSAQAQAQAANQAAADDRAAVDGLRANVHRQEQRATLLQERLVRARNHAQQTLDQLTV